MSVDRGAAVSWLNSVAGERQRGDDSLCQEHLTTGEETSTLPVGGKMTSDRVRQRHNEVTLITFPGGAFCELISLTCFLMLQRVLHSRYELISWSDSSVPSKCFRARAIRLHRGIMGHEVIVRSYQYQ